MRMVLFSHTPLLHAPGGGARGSCGNYSDHVKYGHIIMTAVCARGSAVLLPTIAIPMLWIYLILSIIINTIARACY